MAKLSGDKIYVYWKLVRVTGKVDCPHSFFSHVKTDAETYGRFDDYVSGVGFTTVYPGQTSKQAFELYQSKIKNDCESLGYSQFECRVITKDDYETEDSFRQVQNLILADQFYSPAYEGTPLRK